MPQAALYKKQNLKTLIQARTNQNLDFSGMKNQTFKKPRLQM